MKLFTFSFLFLLSYLTVHAETHTITTPGFQFSPNTLTILEGDTVIFDIENLHNAVEVTEATWNANGTTPMTGGFSLPLGGGTVLPAFLEPGIHYYVCQPHANMGMKGRIIVEETTAVDDGLGPAAMSVYPNPGFGQFFVSLDKSIAAKSISIDVVNLHGEVVYSGARSEKNETRQLDLSALPAGIYVVRVQGDNIAYRRKLIIE